MNAINVLIPIDRSPAVELGNGSRLWKKKLLPVGQVEYRGRMLNFTPEYLYGLARAYAERRL